MVFGKTILWDLIQFFLPRIMVTFLAVGIADLGKRAGKMLRFTLVLSYVYTVAACVIGAIVITIFLKAIPGLPRLPRERSQDTQAAAKYCEHSNTLSIL
jgi:Na+/H+-dicarboxylate symporter